VCSCRGEISLGNFCGIIGFKLRESLIMLALQEGSLHTNNDLIHMHFVCLSVDSCSWLLIPNFYWYMLLSVMFYYEPLTLLRSVTVRWTSVLLIRYFNSLLPVFVCGDDLLRDDIIPSPCGVRYICRNSVSNTLLQRNNALQIFDTLRTGNSNFNLRCCIFLAYIYIYIYIYMRVCVVV